MFEIQVSDKGVIILSGVLTVGVVESLYAELGKLLDNGELKELDCTGVEEIDIAALQVIAAFRKTLREQNRPVECIASLSMREALELSGLRKLFKLA